MYKGMFASNEIPFENDLLCIIRSTESRYRYRGINSKIELWILSKQLCARTIFAKGYGIVTSLASTELALGEYTEVKASPWDLG
jgi:hypothetical protein